MDTAETELSLLLRGLSTAKDKVFEISNAMLKHQATSAKLLVQIWLKEFHAARDEKKKLAMLFVMNDVVMKSRESKGDEYLKEFPEVMGEIINALVEFKSEYLLEELRKIIMVWEKPGALLYVSQYTSQLKMLIQDAINAVQDDRTGASVIQEFEITKKLSVLENKHEANLELAKRVEAVTEKQSFWKKSDILELVTDYKEKCEEELVERSLLLMELAEMLEAEYRGFCQFNQKLEGIKHGLDNSIDKDRE